MPHVNVVDYCDDQLSREAALARVLREEHRESKHYHDSGDHETHFLTEPESLEVQERSDGLNDKENNVEEAENYVGDDKADGARVLANVFRRLEVAERAKHGAIGLRSEVCTVQKCLGYHEAG